MRKRATKSSGSEAPIRQLFLVNHQSQARDAHSDPRCKALSTEANQPSVGAPILYPKLQRGGAIPNEPPVKHVHVYKEGEALISGTVIAEKTAWGANLFAETGDLMRTLVPGAEQERTEADLRMELEARAEELRAVADDLANMTREQQAHPPRATIALHENCYDSAR